MPPTSSPPNVPADALLPASRAGVAEAARLLASGKLVILPTETIYGIAVNLKFAHARTAARALKAKSTPEGTPPSPWVLHVARPEDILAWVPHLSPVARRLITKSLPGPVAFQIKLDAADVEICRGRLGEAAEETLSDGTLTFRCPDAPPTQDVLSAVEDPIAIIGAGTATNPGIFEIADIPPGLVTGLGEGAEEGVVAALDGGPTRYRKSSTLVRIEGEKYAVARQGVIDERILDRFAEYLVLFICSGNTCRSPMASAIGARLIADHLKIPVKELFLRRIAVMSAGVHAARGMRATLEAAEAVKALGGDLSTHVSQPATVDLLRRADVIYTMTNAHREEVLELLPGAERKTFLLDPEGDVSDPIGSSLSVYQQVATRLHSVLQKRLGELAL